MRSIVFTVICRDLAVFSIWQYIRIRIEHSPLWLNCKICNSNFQSTEHYCPFNIREKNKESTKINFNRFQINLQTFNPFVDVNMTVLWCKNADNCIFPKKGFVVSVADQSSKPLFTTSYAARKSPIHSAGKKYSSVRIRRAAMETFDICSRYFREQFDAQPSAIFRRTGKRREIIRVLINAISPRGIGMRNFPGEQFQSVWRDQFSRLSRYYSMPLWHICDLVQLARNTMNKRVQL